MIAHAESFLLDLLRRHDPAKIEGIRCVATTPWTPIPLLVAAPGISGDVVEKLRAHRLRSHTLPEYEPLLGDALLLRFVVPDLGAYSLLEAIAREAVELGYKTLR